MPKRMIARRFAGLCMILALVMSCQTSFAEETPAAPESARTSSEDAVTVMAELIEANLPSLKGDTVAVLPFTHVDGVRSVEGILFAQRLTAALTEHGKVRVVDRETLDRVLAEQKLAALGFIDPATGAAMGHLLGAAGLATGTVAHDGELLSVNVKLIDSQTGEVTAAASCTTPRTIKTFVSPLWEEIARIKDEGSPFDIEFWTERSIASHDVPSLQIGEFLTVHFRSDRDCYVTIFDFTTSGSIRVLFPNGFAPDNRVKAGRIYTLPEADAAFRFRVAGPPGIEQLKLFATTTDTPLFTEDYSVETFRSVTSGGYSVPRDLSAVLKEIGSTGWAESSLEFRVDPAYRDP